MPRKPDDETKQLLFFLVHRTYVIDQKINLLIEHAGINDKLEALAEQLHGPTEALKAAIEANQPKNPKEKTTNGQSSTS